MAKAKFMKAKKRRAWPFILGMVIYALVFLTAAYFGLQYLWDYMTAYEASRPKNTLNEYMDGLTEDHICDLSQEVIDQIDHNIQSEEACRAYIKAQLTEGISYAKKSAESTDTRQVYVLRSNGVVIGEFVMSANPADEYGFTTWTITGESFDFSHLIGDTVTMTVPSEFIVYVNDVPLDESYITESGIHYELLEDFYDDYELDTMSTYVAGPFLGDFEITATDPDGNPVEINEETDMNDFVYNCSEQELKDVDTLLEIFLDRYVDYTGSADGDRYNNLNRVLEYTVSDSSFAQRMRDAIGGLYYAQSKGDEVVSITVNHCVRFEDDLYWCDVTYLVNTIGKQGTVQVTNNVYLYIRDTNNGLKVESMVTY